MGRRTLDLQWYASRLRAMDRAEVASRTRDTATRRRWLSSPPAPLAVAGPLRPPRPLPVETARTLDATAAIDHADRLAGGVVEVFGLDRTISMSIDHHHDPITGITGPSSTPSFRINHRDESTVGNIKSVWELSRLQFLLPAGLAFAATGEERHARLVADHLDHWRSTNPFLTGVHWTSGIEVGLRLVSLVWLRRLLDGWSDAPDRFENDPAFVEFVGRHIQWLEAFPASGSSANNHLVAELVGLYVASVGFGGFEGSDDRAERAREELEHELRAQMFPSGLNREMATEYHGFVLELFGAAALESLFDGPAFTEAHWDRLAAGFDAAHDIADGAGRPPRQGDADDGRVLPLDGTTIPWFEALERFGDGLLGRADDDALATIARSLRDASPVPRSASRASGVTTYHDAGLTILRADTAAGQLWCRLDHGPHGFLSTNAHAHADALAVEVRIDATEIVTDPGTYCYHGEPEWRDYFRSTVGHSTLTVDGRDSSTMAGPFLWSDAAESTVLRSTTTGITARHDGYAASGVDHERTVELDEQGLVIRDRLVPTGDGTPRPVSLSFHLAPTAAPSIDGTAATVVVDGVRARFELPPSLEWHIVEGQQDPPLGWYSERLGHKTPAPVLVGRGVLAPSEPAVTRISVSPSTREGGPA